MKIALIGLGTMGQAIAQTFIKSGHQLTIYNRTQDKAKQHIPAGAVVAESIKAAAASSHIVFTVLADEAAVEEIVLGKDGLMDGLRENSIHISMSTIGVDLSRKLRMLHEKKAQHYVSATLVGRPEQALAGKLHIILAGEKNDRQQVTPLLKELGSEIFEVGEHGEAGNAVKIGVNFMMGAMIESMAEALSLMEKEGIKTTMFMDVVNAVFQSPLYQYYSHAMIRRHFEPGLKMKLGLMEAELAVTAAQSVDASLPFVESLHKKLAEAVSEGHGDLDWSALLLSYIK